MNNVIAPLLHCTSQQGLKHLLTRQLNMIRYFMRKHKLCGWVFPFLQDARVLLCRENYFGWVGGGLNRLRNITENIFQTRLHAYYTVHVHEAIRGCP